MKLDKHERLANEALQLDKAFVLAAAVNGVGRRMTEKDVEFPNYLMWENKPLKRHIKNLENDFEIQAKQIILAFNRTRLSSTTAWFAERFDAWQTSGFGLFDIGRVHEVEQAIGQLDHRRFMDCPPYAQVLLQDFHGAAIRHPEYHLGTDLALLYNLFLDAEAILDQAKRQNKTQNSEHSQSLARSVILTCFNLLESFVSGLASARLLEQPRPQPEVVKKLEDNKLRLRARFIDFPSLITGKLAVIDGARSPVAPLFGECKQRRDSFVHCEPGSKPTKRGYVKEQHFHDVGVTAVRRTVDLTCEAICLAWMAVHGREKPSWLPTRGGDGRFSRVQVTLRPLDLESRQNLLAAK